MDTNSTINQELLLKIVQPIYSVNCFAPGGTCRQKQCIQPCLSDRIAKHRKNCN